MKARAIAFWLPTGLAFAALAAPPPAAKAPEPTQKDAPTKTTPQGEPPLQSVLPRVAFRHAMVLKVVDPQTAADSAIAEAEKREGYFLKRTNDGVTLKVPTGATQAVLAAVEPLGVVIRRTTEAKDVGEALSEARTRLQSREGMLDRYYDVVAEASGEKVVEVERAMTALVQEIEGLRGAITLHQHRLAYAEIAVQFTFRDRRAPTPDGRSSFKWLNTMNLPDLIADFGHE